MAKQNAAEFITAAMQDFLPPGVPLSFTIDWANFMIANCAERVQCLDENALGDLLDFANDVQKWSMRGHRRTPRYGTFAQAAAHFDVPVERIAMAVEAHYWMFADDPAAPIGERQIEHEGE